MTTDLYARESDCRCSHPAVTHVLSEKAPRVRRWCSVATADHGQCECTTYRPIGDPKEKT